MMNSNNRRIFKLTTFILLIGIFTSCSQKKEVHFHYSDGIQIKDSTVIHFLANQLPVQVKNYDSTLSLNVTTCLDNRIAQKLKVYFRKDTSRKSGAMVILDNKTGNVVYAQNSQSLSVYSQRLQTMKMYGILLSLEKGVKLTDTFSWIGKYSKKKYDSTVARLYRMSAPSLEYKYPFDNYSCSDWSTFLQKLNVSEDERDCADGEIYARYYFRTSLFDLVKTCSSINQNGFASTNNLFGKIKSSDGEVIHNAASVKVKVLKTETCIAAKKILKRDPFDLIEFSYPIFHYNQGEIRNGMILSTKNYTIGFLASSKSAKSAFVTKEIYELVSLLEDSRH